MARAGDSSMAQEPPRAKAEQQNRHTRENPGPPGRHCRANTHACEGKVSAWGCAAQRLPGGHLPPRSPRKAGRISGDIGQRAKVGKPPQPSVAGIIPLGGFGVTHLYGGFMPNPATTLADLLEGWALPGGMNVAHSRGCTNVNDLDFWRTQVQAVELLSEVDRCIDALEAMGEPVTHLRDDLVLLHQAVFGYSPLWQLHGTNAKQRRAEPAAPRGAVGQLRTLGIMIERYLTDALKPEATDRLLQLLDEAAELLAELEVDDKTRHYLFDLIADARRGVQEADLFGAARVRASCMALTTELNGQAAAAQNQNPVLARKTFKWVASALLVMGTAFGTEIGTGAADWVLEMAPAPPLPVTAPEDSGVIDAEVVGG